MSVTGVCRQTEHIHTHVHMHEHEQDTETSVSGVSQEYRETKAHPEVRAETEMIIFVAYLNSSDMSKNQTYMA